MAQPVDEFKNVFIAPHPGGEAFEIVERGFGAGVIAQAPDEAVDTIGVRPVRLDRDRGKALFGDKTLRDCGALTIEIVSAMRRFAEKNEVRVPDQSKQGVVVVSVSGELVYGWADGAGDLLVRGHGETPMGLARSSSS